MPKNKITKKIQIITILKEFKNEYHNGNNIYYYHDSMIWAYFAYKIYVKIKMQIKYKNTIKNNAGNFTKYEKVFIASSEERVKTLIQKKITWIKNNVLRNYYDILKTVCSDGKNYGTNGVYFLN